MQAGIITIGGISVGIIEINLSSETEVLPDFEGYNPSGRAEGTDTGKSFHHHGIGHSRPSGGGDHHEHKNRHHFPGHHHHPAPGRHHHPGHDRQEERRSSDDKPYDIPYSSAGNPFDRERFKKELEEKPWLREKMKHISLGENQDPRANLAVIETMMNRAVVRGTSLEAQARRHRSSGVDEGGYYAGWAPHYASDKAAMFEKNIGEALGTGGKGQSNISRYATDNSSGALAAGEIATGKFKHHMTINGESFFSPGSAETGHRDTWQKLNKKAQEHESNKKVAEPKMPEDL